MEQSPLYAEWEACVNAGLDLWEWYTDGYPQEFKEMVMRFAGLRNLKGAHLQDVASPKKKPAK